MLGRTWLRLRMRCAAALKTCGLANPAATIRTGKVYIYPQRISIASKRVRLVGDWWIYAARLLTCTLAFCCHICVELYDTPYTLECGMRYLVAFGRELYPNQKSRPYILRRLYEQLVPTTKNVSPVPPSHCTATNAGLCCAGPRYWSATYLISVKDSSHNSFSESVSEAHTRARNGERSPTTRRTTVRGPSKRDVSHHTSWKLCTWYRRWRVSLILDDADRP